jgi:hypothetical protein
VIVARPNGRVDLAAMMQELGRRRINELHVEAGGSSRCVLAAGLVDELLLYFAPCLLGDTAPACSRCRRSRVSTRVKLDVACQAGRRLARRRADCRFDAAVGRCPAGRHRFKTSRRRGHKALMFTGIVEAVGRITEVTLYAGHEGACG